MSTLLVVWFFLLGCFDVALHAAGEAAKQLLPNGDMEEAGGWQSMNDGTDTVPNVNEQTFEEKHSGKAARHAIITRKISRAWPSILSPAFTTETGKTYEVRFWHRVIQGGVAFVVRNGAGNDNLTPKPADLLCAPEGIAPKDIPWAQHVGRYTETSGGDGAYLRFVIGSSKRVEFFLDDVSVREIDVSAASALKQWRELFPGRQHVCWQKSPWESLLPAQFPPDAPRECRALSVTMGQNEHESCSFSLTNLSNGQMSVRISLGDPPLPVVLRQAVWVTDLDGAKINDALPLLEGALSIPSGESREVWLTIHTRDQKAGDYRLPIDVAFPDGTTTIPLDVKVHPVALPDDKPLYTHYWDELVPDWCGQDVAQALIKDMKAHYVNVVVSHPWPTRMQLDAGGKLKMDFTELDSTLDAYQSLGPKMIIFWLGAVNFLEPQKGFWSDAWQLRFKTWLKAWVARVKEKGWTYERFAINPYDERLGPEVCRMVKLIKETDPKILIYVNATGQTKQEVQDIAPYVDIWAPYLYDYLDRPPYDRLQEVKETARDVLRRSVADEHFWTYANTLANRPKAAPPYRDYRLPVWQAWELGMRGFGYWVYAYKTHWQSHKYEDGPGWAVVYLANSEDAPPGISQKELVVPSKRWEATREGVEDYVYLFILRDAITKARARGADGKMLADAGALLLKAPKEVLANNTDHTLADSMKARVIETIVRIRGHR